MRQSDECHPMHCSLFLRPPLEVRVPTSAQAYISQQQSYKPGIERKNKCRRRKKWGRNIRYGNLGGNERTDLMQTPQHVSCILTATQMSTQELLWQGGHSPRRGHLEKTTPLAPGPPEAAQTCLALGHTWLLLSRFRQVCDTGVGAHQDIAGVKRALQEKLLRF